MGGTQSIVVLGKSVHDGFPVAVDVVKGGRLTGQLFANVFPQEDVLEKERKKEESETIISGGAKGAQSTPRAKSNLGLKLV